MAELEAQAGPIHLFYSYAHNDESLRNELDKHLSLLRQQGHITQWHDRNISAGTDWEHQIDAHLEMAHIILLLISADFLASKYCYSIEMKRALERHKAKSTRVIPILLRPVDWQGAPFAELQILPRNGKPVTIWPNKDLAFEEIAIAIRAVVAELNKDRSSSQMNLTEINPSQAFLSDAVHQQIDSLECREDAEKVVTVSGYLLVALDNLRRFQRRVSELKNVHKMLHEIELQLEGLTATIQMQLTGRVDQEAKASPRWPFIKRKISQISIDVKIIKISWDQVRLKIADLEYFAAEEMDALEEEHFVFDGDFVRGPLWIKELFALQSSFEASMKEQNMEAIDDLARALLERCRFHLYLIDKQLLKAVKELDTASDYVLRNIQ